jgi:hypothetical protein
MSLRLTLVIDVRILADDDAVSFSGDSFQESRTATKDRQKS